MTVEGWVLLAGWAAAGVALLVWLDRALTAYIEKRDAAIDEKHDRRRGR